MVRFRHSAALALVGWYLMAPPPEGRAEAPLSRWKLLQSYDSAATCERERGKEVTEATKELDSVDGKGAASTAFKQYLEDTTLLKCIATDDPRLNEK